MIRIYIIGIIYVIIFLNIPVVRDNTAAQLQIYRPLVKERVLQIRDSYAPAVISIATDLQKNQTVINNYLVDTVIDVPVDTDDNWSLYHRNSITADQFDDILRQYKSPAVGIGAPVTKYTNEHNIDNAYVLYMFIHESTAGTKGVATKTHSTGNIRCTDNNCYNGFQVYSDWETGAKAHIDLLVYYRDNLGDKDIISALYRWAPPEDNNNQALNCTVQKQEGKGLSYPCSLIDNITKWRKLNEEKPQVITTIERGDPIRATRVNALPNDKEIQTAVLHLTDCMLDTVTNALNPSIGLQHFSIKSGQDWSFNDNWLIVNENDHYCRGVPYGGVCNMASQYQIVAKQLGLDRNYGRHPGGLANIDYDDTVVIWSNGKRGGQDLQIINNTTKLAVFSAKIENNRLIVSGWLQ